MNTTPHTHELKITKNVWQWVITYGDQHKTVAMPYFRKHEKVLGNAVKKIIKKHDQASIDDGKLATEGVEAISTVYNSMAPKDPKKWGSEQLPD